MQSVTTSLRPPHHRWDAAGWRRGEGRDAVHPFSVLAPTAPHDLPRSKQPQSSGNQQRGWRVGRGLLHLRGACAHLAVVTDRNYRDYKTLA